MSEDDLTTLAAMSLPALRSAWRSRWGEPPMFRSRDLLVRAYAYRLQVGCGGDLPAARRRQLADLAAKFQADRRFTPSPVRQLKPGSTLVREWGGLRHEVVVAAEGFAYGGETYRSLSKVAERITGTHWNGQVFFGLKARKRAGS